MDAAARRLLMLKELFAHARERLELDLGFKFWDGSTVPADYSPHALTVSIADEGAIAALLRRPKIDTLANLYAAGRIDLLNGTFFDLVARRPKIKTKLFIKALDKRLVFDVLRRFLFVPRGGPWPLEAIKADRPSRHEFAEDKANIHHHYDASNEFYALWLDREMVYTCAYFHDWNDSLEDAQRNKLDLVCRKLRLKAGETLLDLGCGWGSLVIHAAQNYGVKAYGVTLAEEQARYAQEKIERLGLGDLAKVECRDYATVDGVYDKVSAIGFFEHVGEKNFETFYRTVHRSLKPDGFFLNQAITRPAKKDERTFRKKNPDYAALTRYVFPGGELDYIGGTTTESRTLWLRGARCRRLARALPAHLQDLARPAAGEPGGGRAAGGTGEDAGLARLPCRRFNRLRAQHGAGVPDAGVQAPARTVGPATDAGRSLSLSAG